MYICPDRLKSTLLILMPAQAPGSKNQQALALQNHHRGKPALRGVVNHAWTEP